MVVLCVFSHSSNICFNKEILNKKAEFIFFKLVNKDNSINNSSRTWSREIIRDNYERKDKRYGGQSGKFTLFIIGVSEGEQTISK